MTDNNQQQYELDMAFTCCDLNKIKNILKADIDEILDIGKYYDKNCTYRTLLHFACHGYDKELVELLLKRKEQLDINAQNYSGATPLFLFCMAGFLNIDTLQLLIDSGASVNIPTEFGYTPLHIICMNPSNPNCSMIGLLLDAGADINMGTYKGTTPLHTICTLRHLNVLKIMFEKNSEIILDIKDKQGKTALDYVVENNKLNVDLIDEYVKLFDEYRAMQTNTSCETECEYSIAI